MTGGEQGQGRQGQGRASVAVLVTQGRGTPADPALAPVPWCLSLSVFLWLRVLVGAKCSLF